MMFSHAHEIPAASPSHAGLINVFHTQAKKSPSIRRPAFISSQIGCATEVHSHEMMLPISSM